jgi:hypothetical protein
LLDYIRLDTKSTILKQISNNFSSGAILLHPFIQMPLGWTIDKQNQQPHKHIYPTDEETMDQAMPVLWRTILNDSGIASLAELEVALLTSIGAINKKYAKPGLANKLEDNLREDIYYPTEDKTSVLLLKDILDVLGSNGAELLHYSEPIFDKSGSLEIKNINPLDIYGLSEAELIVTDENLDYAFLSIYDSFNTLFLSKKQNVKEIVKKKNWEAIICDNQTYLEWYLPIK